jgi:hypothetical protein
MTLKTSSLFLMNPGNEAFLRKKITRPVFKESSSTELTILAVFFAVCLVIFLILALPAWMTRLDFNNAGVAAQGQVVNVLFENRAVDYFHVRYSFAANGMTYENEQRVPLNQINLVAEQTVVPVEYVAHDPTISRLGMPFEDFGDFLVPGTLLGGGYLLILLVALVIHADRRMQNSELAAKGKLVKGTVVGSGGNQPGEDSLSVQMLTAFLSTAYYLMRRRNQSQFKVKVRYKFVSPVSGKEITKTETAVRNDLDRRDIPDAGTPVAILYRTDSHFRLM